MCSGPGLLPIPYALSHVHPVFCFTVYFASQCILLYRYEWWDLSSWLCGQCVRGPAGGPGILPIPHALSLTRTQYFALLCILNYCVF